MTATNLFAGFDEYMERQEPGYIARRALEKEAKRREWQERKAALVQRYGSVEAVLAPCWREQIILIAVDRWRTAYPGGRWTNELDGWRDTLRLRTAPRSVVAAIRAAYLMPTTFAEAKAEHDYWTCRSREIEDVQADDAAPIGDDSLDLAVMIRADIVRRLAEHELTTTTLADLHARFAMLRASEIDEPRMEEALFRDLTAILKREQASCYITQEPIQ